MSETTRPVNGDGAASEPVGDGNGRSLVTLTGAVIRFAGDSGDGMQLTGDRFTSQTAVAGNDIARIRETAEIVLGA